LHEDRRDGDQEADQKDRTEDSELGLDIEMADQWQTFAAAVFGGRLSSSGRCALLPGASVEVWQREGQLEGHG